MSLSVRGALVLIVGCGGEVGVDRDAGALDGAAGATRGMDGALDQVEPNFGLDQWVPPWDDAMTFDAHVYDDAAPPTCADVGKYPSIATCCNGTYCAGGCWSEPEAGHYCVCGNILGGCVWPLVCCSDPAACVGASICRRW